MRRDRSTTESTYRASPTANERRANLCPRDSTDVAFGAAFQVDSPEAAFIAEVVLMWIYQ